jgi:hypothetical protein
VNRIPASENEMTGNEVRERVFRYLDRCRIPKKGYCHFRDPESGAGFSNIADTFWALSSYRLLKTAPPFLSSTRAWLKQEFDQNPVFRDSPYLFWALGGLELAGEPITESMVDLLVLETERLLNDQIADSELPSLLRDLEAILALRLHLSIPVSEREKNLLAGCLSREDGFSGELSLPELKTRSVLADWAKRGGGEVDRLKERGFRDRVFGYVLVPGSSRSDLFVLRVGLSLRKDPLDPSRILDLTDLVYSCQSRDGGFGLVGGAIPTLEATCAALAILLHFLPLSGAPIFSKERTSSSAQDFIGSW